MHTKIKVTTISSTPIKPNVRRVSVSHAPRNRTVSTTSFPKISVTRIQSKRHLLFPSQSVVHLPGSLTNLKFDQRYSADVQPKKVKHTPVVIRQTSKELSSDLSKTADDNKLIHVRSLDKNHPIKSNRRIIKRLSNRVSDVNHELRMSPRRAASLDTLSARVGILFYDREYSYEFLRFFLD